MDTNTITKFKKRYESVYQISILGREFIFRPITIKELDEILRQDISNEDKDSLIVQTCCLNYNPTDDDDAGYVTTIAEEIMINSGCEEESSVESLFSFRQELNSFEGQMKAIVMEAFHLTLDEIESWTLNKIYRHYAYAEFMIEGLRGYPLSEMLQRINGTEEDGLIKGSMSDFPELM